MEDKGVKYLPTIDNTKPQKCDMPFTTYLNRFLLVANFILLVFGAYYVCNYYPKINGLGIDYNGIIIGTLAILVTVLIGWHIYAIVDVKRLSGNIEVRVIGAIRNYDHEISGAIYHLYSVSYMIQKEYENAFWTITQGLKEQMQTSNPIYVTNLCRLLNEQFGNINFDKVDKQKIEECIKYVTALKNDYTDKLLSKLAAELVKKDKDTKAKE